LVKISYKSYLTKMLPDILKLLHTESPDVANLICSLTNFYYENTRHEY